MIPLQIFLVKSDLETHREHMEGSVELRGHENVIRLLGNVVGYSACPVEVLPDGRIALGKPRPVPPRRPDPEQDRRERPVC